VNRDRTNTYGYDKNGNRTTWTGGYFSYSYDDENRLVGVLDAANSTFRTDFIYDGLSRLRERLEYTNNSGAGPLVNWTLASTTQYIYDGNRVVQERDGGGNPLVAYTRGPDLSGTFGGAGGIGGLLGRSSAYSSGSGNWGTHYFYHADGNGNITYLVDGSQNLAAFYRYDPFGNTLSLSGPVAIGNVYRFSSKEVHAKTGMYYYLYRFYDPQVQRWPNRDPFGEDGGFNLYAYCLNSPVNFYDPDGLLGTPAENLALILAIGPEEAAEILGISVEAAKAIALAGATIGSRCESRGHGERKIQGTDPNPWKGYRPKDPNDPSKGGWKRDPQSGKWKPVPRPPGQPPPGHPTW
jgi:RHS repeat-associated protein